MCNYFVLQMLWKQNVINLTVWLSIYWCTWMEPEHEMQTTPNFQAYIEPDLHTQPPNHIIYYSQIFSSKNIKAITPELKMKKSVVQHSQSWLFFLLSKIFTTKPQNIVQNKDSKYYHSGHVSRSGVDFTYDLFDTLLFKPFSPNFVKNKHDGLVQKEKKKKEIMTYRSIIIPFIFGKMLGRVNMPPL